VNVLTWLDASNNTATSNHNHLGNKEKYRASASGEEGLPSDLDAGYALLEPHDIDPNAGELPPPLRDELQAAFHAQSRGFSVIQLLLNGTPAVFDWQTDALTCERWTDAPRCKVGGITDGLVMLALTGSEGVAQYAALAETTNTAAVLSRINKTILFFYRLPAGARSIEATLLPGVDVLSTDGYVELPSGAVTDGCFWANRYAIAPAPRWLLDQLAALAASQTQTEGNTEMGAGANADLPRGSEDEKGASEMPPRPPKKSNVVSFPERNPLKQYSSKLEAALDHAANGFFVFPVEPNGKKPAIVNWQYAATTEKARIVKWWTENPDYNIGTPLHGKLVVDIDPRHGGSPDELQAKGLLPDTQVSLTQGDGWHFIYNLPDDVRVRNSTGKLGPGIDVKSRGDTSYCLALRSTGVSIDGVKATVLKIGGAHLLLRVSSKLRKRLASDRQMPAKDWSMKTQKLWRWLESILNTHHGPKWVGGTIPLTRS
jgi:hypothetical protein